jgi:hypothetical protein
MFATTNKQGGTLKLLKMAKPDPRSAGDYEARECVRVLRP